MLLMLLPLHIKAVVLLSRMLKSTRIGEGKADEAWIPVGTEPSSPIPPPPSIQNAQTKRSSTSRRHSKRLSVHTGGSTDKENGFAPRGVPTFGKGYSNRLPKPLKLRIPDDGPMARIHDVCSVGYNTTSRTSSRLILRRNSER
jgi:hypothetical protein